MTLHIVLPVTSYI